MLVQFLPVPEHGKISARFRDGRAPRSGSSGREIGIMGIEIIQESEEGCLTVGRKPIQELTIDRPGILAREIESDGAGSVPA